MQGKIHTLCATDVAARGLHIKRLKYVINYDFPTSIEQYCHRVGRTGRDNQIGFAYSLLSRNLAAMAKDLIHLLERCNQVVEPNLISLRDQFLCGEIEVPSDASDVGESEGEN